MPGVSDAAQGLLWRIAGPDAEPRAGQLEAIEAVVGRKERVLLVQRTGWGKSAVYLIASRLLRDLGAGPTLLVSPLLALMRNQIEMAERASVAAASINSSNRADWDDVRDRLDRDEIDLLLVSPERFNNQQFREDVLPTVAARTGLLVVDEAHCISDWGHDFRPDYRRLVRVLDLLHRGVPVLCTTATANDRVIADVAQQLGPDLRIHRGSLDRESLVLSVDDVRSQAERLAWLAAAIPKFEGSGIVYCLTVRDTERVADWLVSQGMDAAAYHGATDPEERERIEAGLLDNAIRVVVATSALGMGFDKPDLSYVIHFQAPGSPIAYYQQVGRAGRNIDQAYGVLLRGHEDRDIQDYFITTAFPPRRTAEELIALLEREATPLTVSQMLASVNVRKSRLEAMLKILEVDGAVTRADGGWLRTLQPWAYDQDRVEAVTQARRAEQRAMETYAAVDGCLMEYLRRQLDDPEAASCGRCANCRGAGISADVGEEVVRLAREHLRSSEIVLDPRKMFPPGVEGLGGHIPQHLTLQRGRALSVYNDGGWGQLVRQSKMEGEAFPDELVDASVRLINRHWRPDPAPEWVTAVPSMLHPELVPGFARRVADGLGLPFAMPVAKVHDTLAQKLMENSAQQYLNIHEAFDVRESMPDGAVLLIDDIRDSGWTLSIVGARLLEAGSGPVYPFVLAIAVSG